nr:uncharacterized protein K02A2.6-like [Aedes albopictus]
MANAENPGRSAAAGGGIAGAIGPAAVAAAGAPPPNFAIDSFDKKKLKWMRWVERLENAFAIYGVVDPAMQKNLLLHHMGSETYDIACDKIAPDTPRQKTYAEIVDALEGFFNPQPLEISENFRFKCRRQGDSNAASPDETVDEYLVALRRIAVTCNFGAYLETALRNQLVFGIKRNDIRSRLLERRQLTLQDARDIAVSMELSRKGGAEIEGNLGKQEVNAVHRSTGFKGKKEKHNKINAGGKSFSKVGQSASDSSCFRCGEKSHFANTCRHKDTVCSFCKLKGHLAKVCMKRSASGRSNASRAGNKTNAAQANYLHQSGDGDDCESTQVREVCTVDTKLGSARFWLDMRVNGKNIRFEVDTGSPVSIVSAKCRDRYFSESRMRGCTTNLVSYCGTSIDVLGIIDASVEYGSGKVTLPLYVVDSDKHPLLGREWLNAIPVDWNSVLQNPDAVNEITNATPTRAAALKEVLGRFPKVFDDSIGKICSVQASLPLKNNTRPVFLKARKIPFNLQKTVEDELDKLEAEGVLTKVNQSNWATPIVPVKKSQGRVRICGDYKQTVNPNLVVDRHPLPTVDELFASLAGGKKFSKIDLVQAYLQLEVAPEDREILTLSTHRGLYRPNRLMYGVASAPAIWQRQMEVILQGIEGVSVFLDDIKVTGPDDATHLRRLEEVLRRLDQHGIRVNKDKYKEAYAIIFGVKRFFQYLYGRKFMLITDNQAISKIFGEHKGLPVMSALRMQHYATYLQSFDYEIRFRKSADHANADAMSRIPLSQADPENVIEEVDVIELNQIETLPLTAAELAQATAEDRSVRNLIQGIKHGQPVDPKDRFGVEQTEFSLQKGCLLRGIRVYVPPALRRKVLDELHSTHFGTTRTKSLARGYCWWVGMDHDIEDMVSNCAECQSVRPEPAKTRLHCWETPTMPFQRVHVDFAGPFQDTYFFILVDAYSKWPEIKVCKSITAESTVNMCREIFATYGIPSVLVSDHGVQFTSETFQQFLRMNGVVHKMGAPYHPSTNGQAERYVQTFKQKLKALKCPKSEFNLESSNILLTYRKMLHPSTGQSPSMLMFGRQIRSRLDLMLPKNEPKPAENLTVRVFQDGDRVRVRDFLSRDKWKFGRIVEKVGKLRYSVRLDDGRVWERHIDHIAGVGANMREGLVNPPREEVYTERTPSTIPVPASVATATEPAEEATTGERSVVHAQPTTSTEAVPEPEPGPSATRTPRSGNVVYAQPLRRSNRVIKPPQKLNL